MESEIHVIPEQFHGAGIKYAPEKAATAPAPHGRRTLLIVLAAGIIFLAAMGVGAYFVLQSLEDAPSVVEEQAPPAAPVVETPAPTPTPAPSALNRPTTTPAPTPPPPPPPELTPTLRSSIDADFDGLTDKEEMDLYRSDAQKPDTDSDGFLDGLEVLNLYNPAANAPTKLADTGVVVEYRDSTFGFVLLVPATWTKRVLDAGRGSVTFTATTGEFVQIYVEENPGEKTLADWYLERSPGVARNELEAQTTKQGYLALKSPDRLTTYIAFGARVVIVAYQPGEVAELNFRRTAEMVVNSFKGQ